MSNHSTTPPTKKRKFEQIEQHETAEEDRELDASPKDKAPHEDDSPTPTPKPTLEHPMSPQPKVRKIEPNFITSSPKSVKTHTFNPDRSSSARRALNLGQFLPVGPSHESTFLPSVFPAFASTEFTSSQEPFTDSLPEASRKSSDISLLDTTVHSTKEIAENLLSPTLKVSTTISRSKDDQSPPHELLDESEPIGMLAFQAEESLSDIESSQKPSGKVDDMPEEEFDSYLFIAVLPLDEVPKPSKQNVLPPKADDNAKHTLVLDLDETLVHCSLERIVNADAVFTVPYLEDSFEVFVRKRPHFNAFLREVSKLFEVAIFTASQQIYAEKLLDILDPDGLIHHRLYRDSCTAYQGNYLKDLTILGRDLGKVIIVDNSPHVFAQQLENGIPIESWYDDDHDQELAFLLPFLKKLTLLEDVRPAIREQFQLQKKVDEIKKLHGLCMAEHYISILDDIPTQTDTPPC